ncbi:MAG TPA: hypothetical protein VFH61_13770 [Thermoleophilia bacterium]|nr:hypothetical protein [Thermoleophilia bacterium]
MSKREDRFKNLDKAFAGFSVVCERGARGDYRGALVQLGAMPKMPPSGTVIRDALNIVLGDLVKCDHKFVDSEVCLKCGWRPPVVEPEEEAEEEAEELRAAAGDQ